MVLVRISHAVERLGQSQRAKSLTRPGPDVVSLASGDPSFDTPDTISEAAIAAIRAGRTHYSAPTGEADLRRAIADQLSELGGGRFGAEDVLITSGANSGIYAMTGWRLGYIAARAGLVRGPSLVHRTSCGFVNTIGQRAAVIAYTVQSNATALMLDDYAARRDLMCRMVNAMPGLCCERPESAFYVFVRVDARSRRRP